MRMHKLMTLVTATSRWMIALALVCWVGQAGATNYTWDSAVDGDWSVTTNWSPVGAPASVADSVLFDATGDTTTNTMDIPALVIDTFRQTQNNFTTDLDGNTLTVNNLEMLEGVVTASSGSLNVIGAAGSTLQVNTAMTVGSGNDVTSATMTLGGNVALQVGVSTASRGTLDVGVNSGASPSDNTSVLTAGPGFNAFLTNLRVGVRVGGFNASPTFGTLDLSAVTTPGVLDVSGSVQLGLSRYASGTVTVSDAVDVKIGTSSVRGGGLYISQGNSGATQIASALTLGTGRFDAYVTDLNVGVFLLGDGTLDASSSSGGVLDVAGDFLVGDYETSTASGSVLLSDNVDLVIGSSSVRSLMVVGRAVTGTAMVQTGTGDFTAYTTDLLVGQGTGAGTLNATLDLADITNGLLDVAGNVEVGTDRNTNGTITLSDNFNTKIGDIATPVSMDISTGGRPLTGNFTAGGNFQAYLTSLTIGVNTAATFDVGTNGTLDLSAVNSGTLITTGTVTVGQGRGAEGTLLLPAIPASADTLLVGNTVADAKGLVDLNGGTFAIATAVVIDGPSVANQGVVSTTIAGVSAGLDLDTAATLTVNQGLIDLTFQVPSFFQMNYWGLRWDGDHVTDLTNLANAGKLVWDDTALVSGGFGPVGIYLQGGTTYVGIQMIPEPAGLTMIALGLVTLVRRRRVM